MNNTILENRERIDSALRVQSIPEDLALKAKRILWEVWRDPQWNEFKELSAHYHVFALLRINYN